RRWPAYRNSNSQSRCRENPPPTGGRTPGRGAPPPCAPSADGSLYRQGRTPPREANAAPPAAQTDTTPRGRRGSAPRSEKRPAHGETPRGLPTGWFLPTIFPPGVFPANSKANTRTGFGRAIPSAEFPSPEATPIAAPNPSAARAPASPSGSTAPNRTPPYSGKTSASAKFRSVKAENRRRQ